MAGVVAVGGFEDFVTQTAKDAHRNVADADVIFQDENGFGTTAQFLCAWRPVGRWRWRRHTGKIDLNGGASAFLTVHMQMPATLMHDAIASCEAEAIPAIGDFGRKERLKQMCFDFFAHSGPGIG